MKYGVILARFQPVHNGHLALIKKACAENTKVLLLVGSADKVNKRNPIPINLRIELLETALAEEGLREKCIIEPLIDLTDESDNSQDWGFYLYANIVSIIKEAAFNIYYSDGYEVITTWFPKFILRDYISMTLMARTQVEDNVSATSVREAIVTNKDLSNLVPQCVIDVRSFLKEFITLPIKYEHSSN